MKERNPGETITVTTRGLSHEGVDKQKRYSQIITVLKECGDMTAKEVAVEMEFRGQIPTSERNFTAPRLTELSKKGVVEPVGRKLCSFTGKPVAIYHLLKGE